MALLRGAGTRPKSCWMVGEGGKRAAGPASDLSWGGGFSTFWPSEVATDGSTTGPGSDEAKAPPSAARPSSTPSPAPSIAPPAAPAGASPSAGVRSVVGSTSMAGDEVAGWTVGELVCSAFCARPRIGPVHPKCTPLATVEDLATPPPRDLPPLRA